MTTRASGGKLVLKIIDDSDPSGASAMPDRLALTRPGRPMLVLSALGSASPMTKWSLSTSGLIASCSGIWKGGALRSSSFSHTSTCRGELSSSARSLSVAHSSLMSSSRVAEASISGRPSSSELRRSVTRLTWQVGSHRLTARTSWTTAVVRPLPGGPVTMKPPRGSMVTGAIASELIAMTGRPSTWAGMLAAGTTSGSEAIGSAGRTPDFVMVSAKPRTMRDCSEASWVPPSTATWTSRFLKMPRPGGDSGVSTSAGTPRKE